MTDAGQNDPGIRAGAPRAVPPARPPAGYVRSDLVGAASPSIPAQTSPAESVASGPSAGGVRAFAERSWAPVNRSAAWRWLFYAVIGFLVGQLVAGALGEVAGEVAGKNASQMTAIASSSQPPEWYVVSTLVGLWIGFFGAPWLASRRQGTGHLRRDLGVRFRWIDLFGIVVGVGAQLLIVVLYAPFQHDIHDFNGPSQKLTGGAHGIGFAVIVVLTVVAVPFLEELFFRGLLFRALVRLFRRGEAGERRGHAIGVVLAVVADGILFGLAHGEWVQFAGLALFGVVQAAVSYRTGRLGMNMVSHASFNLVAVISILGQRGGVIH